MQLDDLGHYYRLGGKKKKEEERKKEERKGKKWRKEGLHGGFYPRVHTCY